MSTTCTICKKTFEDTFKLKRHLRSNHDSLKPYSCSKCGRKFKGLEQKRIHSIIHDKVRPFLCSYKNCLKTFAQASSLLAHYRCHSNMVIPLKCHGCHICLWCGTQFTGCPNQPPLELEPEQKINGQISNGTKGQDYDNKTDYHPYGDELNYYDKQNDTKLQILPQAYLYKQFNLTIQKSEQSAPSYYETNNSFYSTVIQNISFVHNRHSPDPSERKSVIKFVKTT